MICSSFGKCGGCSILDKSYDEQLLIKRELLLDYFREFEDKIHEIVPSPYQYHYRNKMEFTFKKEKDDVLLGLHWKGKFWKIENIKDCLLVNPIVNEILSSVRDFAKRHNFEIYDSKKHKGNFRYLVVKESKKKEEFLLVFVTYREEFPFKDEIVNFLTERFKNIKSVYWGVNPEVSDVALSKKLYHIYGEKNLVEEIGDKKFLISPYSFIQPNIYITERMYEFIKEVSGVKKDDVILDLYSGSGGISIILADFVKYFYGIEMDENSWRVSLENMKINGIKNGEFLLGDVRKVVPRLRRKSFDLVITDPPRSGMSKKSIRRVVELDFNKLIYIGCNLRSTVENLREFLYNGFSVKGIYPFDMFPNTMHIEVVIHFER
ncbi:MAG: 23S rRNA (uracil(1939)-C(5))-methyltransferase RlmD [Caldiserica bacterium]|nr:MAG: 23S rRNA (uracil(1939)-C(5))-methyltransferase RlmD [Caldisericota bacterium]